MIAIVTAMSVLFFIINQKRKFKKAETEKQKFFSLDGLFKLHGAINGIEWRWIKAICKQESNLGRDPRTIAGKVSYDGLSYGVMQIAEGRGSKKEIEIKGFGGETKLNDANYSIGQASKLIAYLSRKYKNNANKVFLAYNQGEINTDRGKDYTRNYAQKIFVHLNWIKSNEKRWET